MGDIFGDIFTYDDLGFDGLENDLKSNIEDDKWDTGYVEDVWRTDTEPWKVD